MTEARTRSQWWQLAALFGLLFLFMSSVNMMGGGFKLMGKGFSDGLLTVASNPFAALMIGVMTTAVVQSSSLTTSLVVALVAEGTLTVESAVPIIMGANIGTTITCTLVALGFVGQPARFRLAFSAGTMHDFFNILTVIILLPVELTTGALSKSAIWLGERLGSFTGVSKPQSPVKVATSQMYKHLKHLLTETWEFSDRAAAVTMVIVALGLLFVSLYFLTKVLKGFLAERMETVLDRYIFRTPLTALAVGLIFTMAVQSSSVTTSIIVPLVGAGVLQQTQAFPYTMGANIGTTITALLAAVATGTGGGLAIASAHTIFNLAGVAIFFPVKEIRNIPVKLAERLAGLTLVSRWYALVYIVVVFFIVPLICILLWR